MSTLGTNRLGTKRPWVRNVRIPTKATELSLPSGMTCERTAPMLVGEASHASLTGNAGS